jgi:hypothetical protein
MAPKIQIRRGLSSSLPINLAEGEFGFTTDSKELYIGSTGGNVKLAKYSDLSSISGGSVIETYETEAVGELFYPPGNYNAWCPSNLQWDKTRGVFAVLINAADAHVFTKIDQYFCTINPDTLISTKPVLVSPKDTSGNAVAWDTQTSSNNFMILNDGTYVFYRRLGGVYQRITSTDGGVTWVNQGPITFTPGGIITTSSNIWGIQKLSSGRLIIGWGAQAEVRGKISWSDNGIDWNVVNIGWNTISPTPTAAEPHIIEVKPGQLVSLARMTSAGATGGLSPEPALISFSNDNGASWTPYVKSSSITDMNASGATAFVHDGMVEVFVASRFYGSTSNVNTGETGAIYHYTATLDNALADKFTLKNVSVFANAVDSVDFHSPCVAIDSKKRLLLMYMDQTHYTVTTAEVNYLFVRGGRTSVPKLNADGKNAPLFGYSGKYIESLVSNLKTEIATLQNKVSLISGVTNPVPAPKGTLIWTKKYNTQLENKYVYDSSNEFSGRVQWASQATPSYNNIETDANGIKYHSTGTSGTILIPVTKPNFSIQYTGTIGNESIWSPTAAGIINGVAYGAIFVAKYGVTKNIYHEFRFENWNGKMKVFIDNIEMPTVVSTNFDSNSSNMYSNTWSQAQTLGYVAGNTYAVASISSGKIYDLKFGEWD